MNPLLTYSATKLAEMIRKKETTSRDAVEAHIERVKKVNPVLNAVVKDCFDEALKEADAADEKINSGAKKLPPFHGVPCTIKECFALTGMPNCSGLVARKDFISPEDATAVSRLRKAGAIPLGVTNTSELCMWMESNNKVYGRTNNPYDPSRIVGGSSGGEGAIIGAGGSPFGLGSDVGGSIRMPAFFNGIFGHKPSGGLVPNTGQFPVTHGEGRYLTTGTMTRRAEDLMPLLKILAGPDEKDSSCIKILLGDVSSVGLSKLTVIDVPDNGRMKVHPELRAAQERCAAHLEKLGAKIITRHIKGFKKSLFIWSAMLGDGEDTSFRELLGNGKEYSTRELFGEFYKWARKESPHTLPALALALIENSGRTTTVRRLKYWVETGRALRHELTGLIGENGIMLYPSYPEPAPRHNKPLMPPFNWTYTAILNVMELPVTQVPLGLNKDGLPLGIQVAGIHGNDHVTIATALEFERAFGGWVMPAKL